MNTNSPFFKRSTITAICLTFFFLVLGCFLVSATSSTFFLFGAWGLALSAFALLVDMSANNASFTHRITSLGLAGFAIGLLCNFYLGFRGDLVKNESTASYEVFLPGKIALGIWEKDGTTYAMKSMVPYEQGDIELQAAPANLTLTVVESFPNSEQTSFLWLKEEHASFLGFPPFPLTHLIPTREGVLLPPSANSALFPPSKEPLMVFSSTEQDMKSLLLLAYVEDASLRIFHKISQEELYQGDLAPLIQGGVATRYGIFSAKLDLQTDSLGKLTEGRLFMTLTDLQDQQILQAHSSCPLINTNEPPVLSDFTLEISRPLALLLTENAAHDNVFYLLDHNGFIQSLAVSPYDSTNVSMSDGHNIAQAHLPAPSPYLGWQDRQDAYAYVLGVQIRNALQDQSTVSPAMQQFLEGAKNAHVDIVQAWLAFMLSWEQSNRWLYPIDRPLPEEVALTLEHIDTSPLGDPIAARWCEDLISEFEATRQKDSSLLAYLEKSQWPFVEQLQVLHASNASSPHPMLLEFAEQIFEVANYLPPLQDDTPMSPGEKARRLSLYLRLQRIAPENLSVADASPDDTPIWISYLVMKLWRLQVEEILQAPKGTSLKSLKEQIASLSENSPELFAIIQSLPKLQHPKSFLTFPLPSTITPSLLAEFFFAYAPIWIGDTSPKTLAQHRQDLAPIDYTVRCLLSYRYKPVAETPLSFDNRPLITVQAQTPGLSEKVLLRLDPTGQSAPQSALGGLYLFRLQWLIAPLPYHVGISDTPSGIMLHLDSQEPIALAPMQSHTTWQGYTFSFKESGTIEVAFLPANYFLVYPGLLLTLLGTGSWWWQNRIAKKKETL